MPLKPGSSKKVISQNIREFHGGKTYNATKAKFGKAKADAQAVAVAMSNARRYADGGDVDDEFASQMMRQKQHSPEIGNYSEPIHRDIRYEQNLEGVTPPASVKAFDTIKPYVERKRLKQQFRDLFEPGEEPSLSPEEAEEYWGPARNVRIRAGGGFVPPKMPWFERTAARTMFHNRPKAVMLNSSVPGRTDKLPLKVPSGSYVLPADVVAGLGQGNSNAGAQSIIKSITSGKFKAPKLPIGKLKKMPFKSGFAFGGTIKEVPIMAAGGEVVIHPEGVADIGHGDLDHGHRFLDDWVVEQRRKQIKQLKTLKPPVRE